MTDMFCFQCEQTAGGTGCTKLGVCGKKPEVAHKHDELVCALVGLARAAEGHTPRTKADELMVTCSLPEDCISVTPDDSISRSVL